MKKESPLVKLYRKDGTKTVLASLVAILIGLLLGSVIVFIVSLTNPNISLKGGWEGIRLVLFGIFST